MFLRTSQLRPGDEVLPNHDNSMVVRLVGTPINYRSNANPDYPLVTRWEAAPIVEGVAPAPFQAHTVWDIQGNDSVEWFVRNR